MEKHIHTFVDVALYNKVLLKTKLLDKKRKTFQVTTNSEYVELLEIAESLIDFR